mgnify:CR=1 FL=1
MSASASNEALFDLLKVLVDKGTITADEYSILKGAASADHEKASVVAPEKVAGIEKNLGKLEKKTEKSLKKVKWAEKVKLVFPNQAEGDRGAHVNISGGGVAKHLSLIHI